MALLGNGKNKDDNMKTNGLASASQVDTSLNELPSIHHKPCFSVGLPRTSQPSLCIITPRPTHQRGGLSVTTHSIPAQGLLWRSTGTGEHRPPQRAWPGQQLRGRSHRAGPKTFAIPLTSARLGDLGEPSHPEVWQTWSHDPGWQPPALGYVLQCSPPPPPKDKRILLGVCAGCGSVTPLGKRQLSVPTASPAAAGRGRQKALFVLGKVSGTRRAGG